MTDEEALSAFQGNIDCLNLVDDYLSRLNFFEIIHVAKHEVRHSYMLAWLMDPKGSHGLGDLILRGFVEYAKSSRSNMDFTSFTIRQEWHRTDLLAVSEKEKLVLCIENKVEFNEHDDQLDRYQEDVRYYFPGYEHYFLYLTPRGKLSSKPDVWKAVGYQTVLDIIEQALVSADSSADATVFIKHYADAIRRNIVEDEELKEICQKIYKEHRRALDLILKYKPERAYEPHEVLGRWMKAQLESGRISYDENQKVTNLTSFTTTALLSILKRASGYDLDFSNGFYYQMCIRNIDDQADYYNYKVQFTMDRSSVPEELVPICKNIMSSFRCSGKKRFVNKAFQDTEVDGSIDELSEEELTSCFDSMLCDVQKFEKDLEKVLLAN